MKSYQRAFILLLVALAIAALLSPWVAALWNSVIVARPEWERYRYSFSHIFGRTFMIAGIAIFLSCRSWIGIRSARDLGLGPLSQGLANVPLGFFLAITSVALLGVLMSAADVFEPYFRVSFTTALRVSVKALLGALAVGFLEEIFFRGIIFKGLLESTRRVTAFTAASLFFAAIHFVKPGERFSVDGIDPLAGGRYLSEAFAPLLDPLPILPGLLGLFVIALVLSYAFLRTGSIYLSMGLHAGWVFGIKTIRIYGDFVRGDLGWLFGSSNPKIVSGVATWLGILCVGVVVHFLTRKTRAGFPPSRE
jgi:membrane protease YdiL (CAAX protease family)